MLDADLVSDLVEALKEEHKNNPDTTSRLLQITWTILILIIVVASTAAWWRLTDQVEAQGDADTRHELLLQRLTDSDTKLSEALMETQRGLSTSVSELKDANLRQDQFFNDAIHALREANTRQDMLLMERAALDGR